VAYLSYSANLSRYEITVTRMPSIDSSETGLILVLSGLSGSGKSYLTDHLIGVQGFIHVPPLTTRAPRPGEKHMVDCVFCSEEEFHALQSANQLLCVNQMFGNWYAWRIQDFVQADEYKRGKSVIINGGFK